jgi:radical SAM superfamily enzyme YgiQ (UPF0313 family)
VKVTFVRPNLYDTRSGDAMEPLVFAVLQSLTPPGVETVLHDERLAPIPYDEPTDLAALTVETYTARRAYQIATEYRRRGVPVVMGGYQPTFLPDEALRFADAVVQGDAEGIWPRVLADAAAGRLQRVYRQDGFAPLGGRSPDRSIFAGKRYAPVSVVQYGRGCRYACEFCSIRAFYGSSLRQRPIDEVVAELGGLGRRHVFFADDNLFVDVPRTKALLEALVPLRLRWSCQVSIDLTADAELMRLMERSGCTTALVGFESLKAGNLRQMKKAWNLRSGSYERAVRTLHDAGVMVYGTFILGYDEDGPDDFERAVEFAMDQRLFLANFNPLTPTPGAALFDRLRREGRLLHEAWWLDPDFRYGEATFRPRGMTPEQLTEGCWRARRQFNTWSSFARRLWNPRMALRSAHRVGLFAVANWVSRREIHAKQGRGLGASGPLEAA